MSLKAGIAPLRRCNISCTIPYASERSMSSGVRRPVVGSGPRRIVHEESRKKLQKDESTSVVPDHMKLFAEFFERSDGEKLEPFMTLHHRQFVIERRAVLEYGPYLSKLELSSVLPKHEDLAILSPAIAGKTKKKSKSSVALHDTKAPAKAIRRKSNPS